MPIPPFLTKVFGGGKAKEVATTIIGGLDELFTSKEEKLAAQLKIEEAVNSHLEEMQRLANAETESYLKDVQSARDANVRIQESDKASWWAKNTGYLLDIFLGGIWGITTIILLLKAFKVIHVEADFTAVLSIYSTVTAVFMMSVQFHRGTSRGSEEKSKELKELRFK